MWRILVITFLAVHGLVHVAVWAAPAPYPSSEVAAAHSWLLGDQRALALTLAFVAVVFLVAAAIGLWARATWWRPLAVGGLTSSFLLMLLFFDLRFSVIELVNAGLALSIGWLDWPSRGALGA
jgi:hypothetical protein